MIHLQVYVCLHHRHPLTLLSPTPKLSKGASFTHASKALPNFSPTWLHFPGGSAYPFESQPNRLWWRLCALHESTAFHWEKCMLCSMSSDIKWQRSISWHYSSSHKRYGCLSIFLLMSVVLNVLKPMSDIRSNKSSQCENLKG